MMRPCDLRSEGRAAWIYFAAQMLLAVARDTQLSRTPSTLTKAIALKTLVSNAILHSSGLESATFFTGSNAPWLTMSPSTRPKRSFATSTAFLEMLKSERSPATTSTLSAPYWSRSWVRADAVRETRTSLWDWLRR